MKRAKAKEHDMPTKVKLVHPIRPAEEIERLAIAFGLSKKFAIAFMERAEELNYKGKQRDKAALDYYIGAAKALEIGGQHDFSCLLVRQARHCVAVRGYAGVVSLAEISE